MHYRHAHGTVLEEKVEWGSETPKIIPTLSPVGSANSDSKIVDSSSPISKKNEAVVGLAERPLEFLVARLQGFPSFHSHQIHVAADEQAGAAPAKNEQPKDFA